MTKISFLKFTQESWLHKLENAQVRMSNDNDGVVTSSLLRHEKGWETNQFYDYEVLARRKGVVSAFPVVAVDCGVTSDTSIYSIDNHVGSYTRDSKINPNAINLNLYNNVTLNSYRDKYAMSTTLLTYVALGKSLPSTEVGKMILIALDVGYKGFYKGYEMQYLKNLEQLGLKEELLPILEKYTFADFKKFLVEKLGAGKDTVHLFMGEGKLWVFEEMYEVYEFMSKELGFPIELPKGEFTTVEEYQKLTGHIDALGDLRKRDDIASWAYINSKTVSYSKRIPKRKAGA